MALKIKDVYKIEILKLIKRKDIWLMLTMILIPIFYASSAYFGSNIVTYNAESKEYAFSFAKSMFEFVQMILIYMIFIILSTSRSLAGEIHDKSILLYSQRINNRKNIYISKSLALISVFTIIVVIFYVVSIILFYTLVLKTDIAVNIFIVKQEFIYLLSSTLAIYVSYIFLIHFSLMLSCFFKPYIVIIIGTISLVSFTYLNYFPYVKYLSPTYYILKISEIEKTNDYKIITLMIGCLAIHTIYAIIFNTIGIKKFKKRDL